ncbi:MAG: hypothetical protein IJX87_00190 [Clostridia bacterium]|nr:hypothetical protein [Clostridia bacterium]
MRKNSKKISLAILALTAVSLSCVAVGNLSFHKAAAATSLNTLENFRVEKVSVRLAVSESETNGGFRFETLIPQTTYAALENVTEVGTLFVPTGFNVADAELALDAQGNAVHNKTQKVVLEGGAENRRGGLVTTDDGGEAVISYRAYINDIPSTAYNTEITARSYVIADGVTYYTETVSKSVGSVATAAYYDVTSETDETYCNQVADGWYSPFTEAQRAEIGAYVTTSAKTYEDEYVLVESGNATLDLTKLSVAANDVVGVMVDGEFVEWSLNGTTLTYATTVGERTLTLATTNGVYTVALVQADNVITTAAEMKAWVNKDDTVNGNFTKGTYTVLANDISAASLGWVYTGVMPSGKVFNGLGHTIDGFMGGMGIVRYLDGGTTTWKNVNYTNYSGEAVFYQVLGGIYENITISGTVDNKNALLGFTINRANTLIKNCVFNLNHETAGTAINLALKGDVYNDLTLINTTVIYGNGQLTTTDLDLSKGSNYYLYDVDDVNTNYYAKVSGGTATFTLSQMGETAPTTISKLLVNGVETQATVADGVLSYPATATGATTLMMTTDKGLRVMNIVHADNVITSWTEYNAWALVAGGGYNSYEYTVLASDITAPAGNKYTNGGYFEKTFDGLGHTIDGFTCGHGVLQRLLSGATWKNVNYTNLTAGDQGLFGYLAGGTFENIHIQGSFAVKGAGFFAYGINSSSTVINNCTFTLTDTTTTSRYLTGGQTDYYALTLTNTTVNYSGTIDLLCSHCKTVEGKYTFTNSTINNNYGA